MYKRPFYQIVESNRIEKSIRQRESDRIIFFPESECSIVQVSVSVSRPKKVLTTTDSFSVGGGYAWLAVKIALRIIHVHVSKQLS